MTRHHYVPQMYLRRFADGAGRVVLVNRDDLADSEIKTAKQALHHDDFYAWDTGLEPREVEDPEILDPEHVEKLLSVFESRAAAAFGRMIESGRPPDSPKDRYHLTNFIALQAARGQRFRGDLSQVGTYAMRQHMLANTDPDRVRDWLAARGDPHAPEDVAAFIERAYGPDGPRLVPDRSFAIQHALRFAMTQLAPSLWVRSWQLVRFEEPCLLTSDEPVVALDTSGEPVSAVTAPIVLMAVDGSHLLVMRQAGASSNSLPEEAPTTEAHPGELAVRPEQFNALVATQAEEFIVHHPDDSGLVGSLVLGPRTEWQEEILEVHEDDATVTVRGRLRRGPANQ